MRYYLLAFLFILGCKNQSESYLVGKWKVITHDRNGKPTIAGTMEFDEHTYTIPIRGNRYDTFEYILRGDTLITNRVRESEKDISFIHRINNDSARITVMALPMTFVIAREK